MTLVSSSKRKPSDCFYAAAFCLHFFCFGFRVPCPERGIISSALSWMQKPRCGVPDKFRSASRSRRRRYALTGQKWQRTHITYT
ncbi:unnamed protein product [Oreochromis niloticus]|nr:unnamed protein product [Mustela putorius furo]